MIEYTELYLRTFYDFLVLRPRRFLAIRTTEPSRYLSPNKFLIISVIILLSLSSAAFLLLGAKIVDKNNPPPLSIGEIARLFSMGIVLVMLINLIVVSLFFRVFSAIWPIKGKATFRSIFDLQCYMTAIHLIGFIIIFTIYISNPEGSGPNQQLTGFDEFLLVLLFLYMITASFIFNLPGLAAINGVSSLRVFAGFFFWCAIFGIITSPFQ